MAAASASSMSIAAITFVPKEEVSVPVGKTHATLYPKLDSSMPIWERAHAYHVNKTAIMNLNVGVQLQLDTLGSQLNMSSVIDGCKADWLDYYQEHWMDFQHNLTILSFHDSAGRVIPSQNCSTAADPLVLKPIQDGNLDQCRPSDIRFVRVQLSLDFAHLITAPQPAGAPPPLTLLRTDYYIELPQTAVQLQNGLNQPYQLVTYTGPADLRLMSVEEVRRVILVPSLQDSPISLLTADFNLPGSVRTDSTAIVETITNKILKLAFNQICATLFSHLCPSYTDQPYAAVEVIKQSYIDADGNRISSRVFAYHHRMLLAMRPFAANKTLPVSVCNKFIDGLDPRLSQYFEGFYPDHHKIHDLNGQSQRTHFELIYIAAMKAEQAYRVAGDTAHEAVGQTSGQSFNASAYPSQAESTFAKYADPNSAAASSSRSRQGSNKCFGCGSPDHLWMDSNKNIICPKCDNPKIQKAAKDNFKAFRKSRKAAAQAKADKKREFNYDDLDEENKAKVKKQVFEAHPVEAASVVSSITLPSTASPSSPSASNPSSRVHKTFVCYVPVMTVAPAKRILPVQVDTAFPHIELPLGHIDGDQFPGIMGMVDSCAACTTGNFHYIAKIAKMYPHTLVRLYAPEDYSPIILSGVVSKDAIPVTTDLTIAFEFHIPFLTRDGSSASIIIAVGPDVSVNVIFGLPFIKTTGGILDLVSDRFEVHNLVSEPFPVVYLRSRNFVPKDDGHPPPSTQYQNIIQEITRLEQYVTQVLPAPDRSVSFGPTTIGSPGQQLHATSLSGSSPDSIVRWVPPTSTGFNHDDYYDPLLRNMPNPEQGITSIDSAAHRTPIQVVPKPKRRHKLPNVFVDDRGFPDQSDTYDTILKSIDGGPILRKLKYPAPPLDVVDETFNVQYDESLHGELLRKYMDLSHLDPDVQEQVYTLVKKYWAVFDESTAFVPVKNYQCDIDTGTASPIAVKKILYGHREIPRMRQCIAALQKVGHIRQMYEGSWLFKALLAPKPHQEHIYNIEDFVWRFCVNYIPLNAVTRIIAYPIPRCDTAVDTACGRSQFFFLFDATMGYHQLAVTEESQEKLAFQGPDAIKWTYTVMPFGPTNGPATFISFIHDISSVWKQLATDMGIIIDEDTNSTNIVDDIFSWGHALLITLRYIECILRVCKAYRLTLSLKKSHIFPKRVEFVGIDVCPDGNRPAMSKFEILQYWPDPHTVRDVHRLVGFGQFYSKFIPNFELLMSPLREVMKYPYDHRITPELWTADAANAWSNIKSSILADPCIMRYDHRKLTVLRSDFSSIGFGYVACQPANDDISLAAMHRCMAGQGFHEFLTKDSTAVLRPVAFGSRRARNNECHLHSHLGEGFAGDWAINKCRHMCFGQRFVWVTDCYAIKFILTYTGGNPAVLRLQMRLMCWDMDIVHRTDEYLQDADYWSRVGADLCYDPLLRQYLQLTQSIRSTYPPPTELPMKPEHMPYFRGPRFQGDPKALSDDTSDDVIPTVYHHTIPTVDSDGFTFLSNIPVKFGRFPIVPDPSALPSTHIRALYNANITDAGWKLSHFSWVVYGFNSGHFSSTVMSGNLPFTIHIACDPYVNGRALFHEFGNCSTILSSAAELLHHVRSAGDTTFIHGYLIHSHHFASSDSTTQFWQLQVSIVAQLRLINRLCIVVAIIHPDHDSRSVAGFKSTLARAGWLTSTTSVYFPDIGDSVAGKASILIAVHSSTTVDATPLQLKQPPTMIPRPLASYIWEPFNTPTYSVSFGPDDQSFAKDIIKVTHLDPASAPPDDRIRAKYFIHRPDSDLATLAGAAVQDLRGICPPFNASPNQNLFRSLFGIEFIHEGATHIRPISQFEFASAFGLQDNITYRLSHPSNQLNLDVGVPSLTSDWIFSQILDRLIYIRDANTEIIDHSPTSASLLTPMVPVFLNGVITTRLPSHDRWIQAIHDDDELSRVKQIILNPSQLTKANLKLVNYNYRHALRNSHICIEDGLLIYREPLVGGKSYARLTLVPTSLRNIIFVAFHSNPIGGHLNLTRTLHHIRLRYYWPHMYRYIEKMCNACPGCALANRTRSRSSELIYSFPIEAPFMVLHVDAYVAGQYVGFEGSTTYLIACCGMCSFACVEPVAHGTATSFASAFMKIQLRFGFCHTFILDKDSKFLGVFKQTLDLLQINYHILAGDNHNPMLVKRINRYLNKGLKIMTNERGTVRVAMESILLLLYAWNSCPIPGTDISRSLVVVGREFTFPIDYSSNEHWKLTNTTPASVQSYSKDLAIRLEACREVAGLLVQEHRAWHRELVNARQPSPRTFTIGDIVFARRTVRSDAKYERVDKLAYAYTGPWKVTAILPGGSYSLAHCNRPSTTQKKHASDLSPYPLQLIPFQPLDGADSRYSTLYKAIIPNPFIEAGITGFDPPQPFQIPAQFTMVHTSPKAFIWPMLADFNQEVFGSESIDQNQFIDDLLDEAFQVSYTGPPPAAPIIPSPPIIPPLPSLIASIITSTDRLFFIAHKFGDANFYEWRLVQIDLNASMQLYPSCLQDGWFLVDFYLPHPSDIRFNATNQRYWLHYHQIDTPTAPSLTPLDSHLIKPSDSSVAYATRHHLVPCRRFVNISHQDTYICGPFDFAIINGCKSRDRIAQEQWDILAAHSSMFTNAIPSTTLPSYSIHVDQTFHITEQKVPFPVFTILDDIITPLSSIQL